MSDAVNQIVVVLFAIGYLAIIFEYVIKVNKTAVALLMATAAWTALFVIQGHNFASFEHHLSATVEIILFLLGAMTIVELIDSHKGFRVITDFIQTNSKRKTLWIIGVLTFFLSAILDNLTTTIVMISLLRRLIPDRDERLLLGAMVVIAANTGGAWTPIGDVTTTMLWIHGNISSLRVIKSLFVPSAVSLLIALTMLSSRFQGNYPRLAKRAGEEAPEPSSRAIFFCGIAALLFVPVFKTLTGLPPFMGILIGLGFLWLLTDLLHGDQEDRRHLRIPHILTKIDITGVLFFLGILLSVSALDTLGLLRRLADVLDLYIGNQALIATAIGFLSAVIDNVPLVAASMGMYDLQSHPTDSFLWIILSYCAGTGGSILIIGSAAGVALMGIEKVDFIWYVRKVSWVALVSYLGGIAVYLIQYTIFSL